MAIKVSTNVINQAAFISDSVLLSRCFYYRGSARGNIGELKEAADDFKIAAQLDVNNKDARASLKKCLQVIRSREGIQYVPETNNELLDSVKLQ